MYTSEVEKYLKNLNINKPPGSDQLSPGILKECALELSTYRFVIYLTSRFNLFQFMKRDHDTERKTIAKSR